MSLMVTKIRKGARRRVFLREWRKHLGLDAVRMAERLEIERESYYRLERQPYTLSAGELLELAEAMGIEPEQFFRPPEAQSLDAIAKDATPEQLSMMADVLRRVLGRAS
jgi:transcriptional regulator with XRE-family HTH domain